MQLFYFFALLVGYVVVTWLLFAGIEKAVRRIWPAAPHHFFPAAIMFSVSAAWPFLLLLVSQSIYVASCNLGNAGAHVYEDFRVDAFVHRSYDRVLPWIENASFIENCSADCSKKWRTYDRVFEGNQPWSEALKGGAVLEGTWRLVDSKIASQRHTQMWVADSNAKECVATTRDSSWCIAAKEIDKISAQFVLQDAPFLESTGYESERIESTREWRWFAVEKHQQHLVRDGTVVARYVWYAWHLFPNSMLRSYESCPANTSWRLENDGRSTYWNMATTEDGLKLFWTKVLNPNGVKKTE